MMKSIRYGSFCEDFKCSMMEIVRLIFYYYARGFSVDSIQREMTGYKSKLSGAMNRNTQ